MLNIFLRELHPCDRVHPPYSQANQHVPLFQDPTRGNQAHRAGRRGAYAAGAQEGAMLTSPHRQWRRARMIPCKNSTEAEAGHRTKGQRCRSQTPPAISGKNSISRKTCSLIFLHYTLTFNPAQPPLLYLLAKAYKAG